MTETTAASITSTPLTGPDGHSRRVDEEYRSYVNISKKTQVVTASLHNASLEDTETLPDVTVESCRCVLSGYRLVVACYVQYAQYAQDAHRHLDPHTPTW